MACEAGLVKTYSLALHTEEYLHQRHLDGAEELGKPCLLEALCEVLIEEVGDVRVFRSVELKALGLDLTQVKLLRRLRGDHLLEGHHLIAEELLRQLVQPVAHIGVEQVVRDHRVEVLASRLDAVGEEDVEVVLEVLPDLQRGRALEDGAELVEECRSSLALSGYVEVIGRLSVEGEGDGYQLCCQRIGARGLGVEGDDLGLCRALDEGGEGCRGEYLYVHLWYICGGRRLGFLSLLESSEEVIGWESDLLWGRCGSSAEDAREERAELQLLEESAHRLFVLLPAGVVASGIADGHVTADRRQIVGEADVVCTLDELLARSALDLRGVGEEVLYRAVFAEELLCALLTDTLTAGDVVYLVPEECEVVDDLRGGVEAELLPYLGFAPDLVAPALHRAVHADVLGDELPVVLVGCDHQHLVTCTSRQIAQRTDDVVRLEVGDFDSGDAVGGQKLTDERYGDADPFGRLFALRLVSGVLAVAEGATCGVKDDGDLLGILLREEVLQHEDEAEDSAGIAPLAVEAWGFDEGVVGAVDQGVRIEEEESLGHIGGM